MNPYLQPLTPSGTAVVAAGSFGLEGLDSNGRIWSNDALGEAGLSSVRGSDLSMTTRAKTVSDNRAASQIT